MRRIRAWWLGSALAAMISEGEVFANVGALLLRRPTYEDFYEVWPKRTDSPYLDNIQKYVASRTLKEPLAWKNCTLLKGGSGCKIEKGVGQAHTHDGELIQSLVQHNLVDEYILLIHPLVLGSGRRLFKDVAASATLKLVSSRATEKGLVVATYIPA